jgi:hypothetical protein
MIAMRFVDSDGSSDDECAMICQTNFYDKKAKVHQDAEHRNEEYLQKRK